MRDLGPWLIPPLAFLAVALPHSPGSPPQTIAPATQTSKAGESAVQAAAASHPSARKQLDRYRHDGRHLLWEFLNTTELSPGRNSAVRITVAGDTDQGKLSINENLNTSEAGNSSARNYPSDEALARRLTKVDLNVLIATLPDPIYSQLPHEFDRALEGIQMAVAEAGYVLYRADLPWTATQALAEKEPEERDPYDEPGVILFRSVDCASDACTVLLVFVAGETPVSGIHKLALSSALQQAAELASLSLDPSQPAGAADPTKLALLTPFFTGSQASLEFTLASFAQWLSSRPDKPLESFNAWRSKTTIRLKDSRVKLPDPRPFKLTLLSGDALAVGQEELDEDLHAIERDHANTFTHDSWAATAGNGSEISDLFLDYLATLNVRSGEVAILRESGTGFGEGTKLHRTRQFLAFIRQNDPDYVIFPALSGVITDHLSRHDYTTVEDFLAGNFEALNNDIGPMASKVLGERRSVPKRTIQSLSYRAAREYQILVKTFKQYSHPAIEPADLPFPLHVSQIRTAPAPSVVSQVGLSFASSFQSLFPVLTATSQHHDQFPSFSELDKASAARVMSKLLSTLSSEQYHYVGIQATDIQDTLYLAREIERTCPDAVIFCLGGDLLFLNPDVSQELRGTLLVGTYPLFPLTQHWTYPWGGEHAHRLFQSESQQGIYNATLILLGQRANKLLDYDIPFAQRPAGRPPVWVTAVGKDQLVPIALLAKRRISGAISVPLPSAPPGNSESFSVVLPSTTKSRYSYQITNLPPATFPGVTIDNANHSWAVTLLFWLATVLCLWISSISLWRWPRRERGTIWRIRILEASPSRVFGLESFLLYLSAMYAVVSALYWLPCWAALNSPILTSSLDTGLGITIFITIVLLSLSLLVYLLGGLFVLARNNRDSIRQLGKRVVEPVRLLRKPGKWLLEHLPQAVAVSAVSPASQEGSDKRGGGSTLSWPEVRNAVQSIWLGVTRSYSVVVDVLLPGLAEALSTAAAIMASLGTVAAVCLFLARQHPGPGVATFENKSLVFAVFRYIVPGNGVSPFPPIFFSMLAILLWSASNVRRAGLAESTAIDLKNACEGEEPEAQAAKPEEQKNRKEPGLLNTSFLSLGSGNLGDVAEREARIVSIVNRGGLRLPGAWIIALILTGSFMGCLFRYRELDLTRHRAFDLLRLHEFDLVRSVEGVNFDVAFAFLFATAYFGLVLNFLRFGVVWGELHRLLNRISWHPLRESCAQLGLLRKAAAAPGEAPLPSPGQVPELSLSSPMPTFTALEFSVERADMLLRRTEELRSTDGSRSAFAKEVLGRSDELRRELSEAQSHLISAIGAQAKENARDVRRERLQVQGHLANICSWAATILEEDNWRIPSGPAAISESPEDRWRRAGGLFLASRVLGYTRGVLFQLRNLLGFGTAGMLVMLMAVSSYPFPRSDTLLRFSWMMMLGAVVVGTAIFIQMSRDRILSLLQGGTPGKIDWNSAFVGHLVVYALIPMLALLGVVFPPTLDSIIRSLTSILPGIGH